MRNCWLPAFYPFDTMVLISTGFAIWVIKKKSWLSDKEYKKILTHNIKGAANQLFNEIEHIRAV